MARILSPTDYGLTGMLGIFIIISQLIADGGLSQALIRKIDRTEQDCSTTFFCNMAIGLALYVILFVCAPVISSFYEEPQLTSLLRVMAISIVIQSSLVVHRAVLTARLDFKTQAKSTLIGAIISGIVGLSMAYNGYGVWSLVALQVTNQVVTAITLWYVSDWRPRICFSSPAFSNLFSFGSKLLWSNIFQTVYQSVYNLVIGKIFSAYALGCYVNARQIGYMSSENLTNVVQRAIYPVFCQNQNDDRQLKSMLKDYLQLSALIIAPLSMGLASLSIPLVLSLLGPQWLYTARLLQILCFSFLLFPLNTVNLMILKIKGNGKAYLNLQMVNIICGVIFLALMSPFGLSAVCCGIVASTAINYILNAYVAGKAIGLGITIQLKALLPIMINSAIMAIVVYGLQFIIVGEWLKITLCILIGGIIYTGLSIIFQTRLCNLCMRIFTRCEKNRYHC